MCTTTVDIQKQKFRVIQGDLDRLMITKKRRANRGKYRLRKRGSGLQTMGAQRDSLHLHPPSVELDHLHLARALDPGYLSSLLLTPQNQGGTRGGRAAAMHILSARRGKCLSMARKLCFDLRSSISTRSTGIPFINHVPVLLSELGSPFL
jgi:hypothetical protein